MKNKQYIKPRTIIYHVNIQPIANMMSGGGYIKNGVAETKSQNRIWDDDDDADDYAL